MDEQSTQPEVTEETQVQETEPSNIAEAFKLISRTNKEVPAPDVSTPDSGGEAGTSDSEPEDSSDAVVPAGGQEQGEISPANGDVGGLTNQSEEYDYSAPRNKVLENIKSQALAETKKMFSDEGIDVVNGLTLNDLIERPVDRTGEPTGEVLFKDPDHPGKYISRNDARAWINDYNADVKAEFNRIANEKYNELMSNAKPIMELMDFAPKFDKMDKMSQDLLADMIEPYAIKNGNQIVGYNCDLNAAAKQVEKMVSRINKLYPSQQTNAPVTTPEVDIKSGNNGGNSKDEEPKNIEEAMKLFRKQNKKG